MIKMEGNDIRKSKNQLYEKKKKLVNELKEKVRELREFKELRTKYNEKIDELFFSNDYFT